MILSKTYDPKTVQLKALTINNEPLIYGTFAEIGAGQEVARHFFHAGKASQTIAKTISAYDMVFSDEIYGKENSGRYVCESRLQKMLDKEYSLLDRRLKQARGSKTCFFAFADTVATGSESKRQCHGWVGVTLQLEPMGEPHNVIMHVRMLDKYRLQQQEILGVLGVNLIYSAFYSHGSTEEFLTTLFDQIKESQIHVDVIKIKGPQYKNLNERVLNLELVKRGWSDAVLFNSRGEISHPADELFKKAILVQRGHYDPVTLTHLEIFKKGREQFMLENTLTQDETLNIFEITMGELSKDSKIDEKDFLKRIDMLSRVGGYVLISNFKLFYQIKNFLAQLTSKPISIIIGANIIERLFISSSYDSLAGGLMEGLGKLFNHNSKVLVYPYKTSQVCMTAQSMNFKDNTQLIYDYYKKEQNIKDISGCDEAQEYFSSKDAKKLILEKNKKWETLVPKEIAEYIETHKVYES